MNSQVTNDVCKCHARIDDVFLGGQQPCSSDLQGKMNSGILRLIPVRSFGRTMTLGNDLPMCSQLFEWDVCRDRDERRRKRSWESLMLTCSSEMPCNTIVGLPSSLMCILCHVAHFLESSVAVAVVSQPLGRQWNKVLMFYHRAVAEGGRVVVIALRHLIFLWEEFASKSTSGITTPQGNQAGGSPAYEVTPSIKYEV